MTINPVLRRELTERWRGRRTFIVFTVYVALLAGITQLLWWIGTRWIGSFGPSGGFGGGPDMGLAVGPMMGRFLFENLLGFVLLLVLFIAPGYAAAQISGERERRSLPLLQVTLLRPFQIVAGKLGASVAWLVLLIVAALPLGAATFFLGGVAVADLLRAVAYVLVITVSIAAMGLGISAMTRRTTASVVLTYGLVLFLVIGSLVGAVAETVLEVRDGPGRTRPQPVALYANPFYGLADAARVRSDFGFGRQVPSVLTPFGAVLPVDRVAFGGPVAVEVEAPLDGPRPVPRGRLGVRERSSTPVWLIELGLYASLGAAGLVVATRRIRTGRVQARPRDEPDEREDQAAERTGPWEEGET